MGGGKVFKGVFGNRRKRFSNANVFLLCEGMSNVSRQYYYRKDASDDLPTSSAYAGVAIFQFRGVMQLQTVPTLYECEYIPHIGSLTCRKCLISSCSSEQGEYLP